jgi:LemA protein
MRRTFWIALLLVVGIGLFLFVGSKNAYNRMVEMEENVEAQWSQVENVYQRRADLIPNLVNTVKGYKDFEQETLTQVTEARAKVGQVTVTPEILENPEMMNRFTEAQNQLSQTLSRLLSVSEAYPDLKANESFNNLMVQLEGTENRISVERKRYNDLARDFNAYIRRFPNNLYASFFAFDRKTYFEAAQGAEQTPTVDFSN